MNLRFAAALLCLSISPAALSAGHLEARFASSTLELDDSSDELEIDGVGADLRGQFETTGNLFFRGSLLTTSGDEVKISGQKADLDSDITMVRLGGGFQGAAGSVLLYGAAEYGELEIEFSGDGGSFSAKDDGFILSGGIRDDGKGAVLWQAELGYVTFDELDGVSFEFALGYRFSPSFAALIGGQAYSLEDSEGGEGTLSAGTLGLRYTF